MERQAMISPQEVAEWLGVSVDSVYREYKTWGIPAVRIGRQIRFKISDIEAYLEGAAA